MKTKTQEKAKIGLGDRSRDKVGRLINQALADEYHLSAATKDYHWNVTGPNFHGLHIILDKQYHELDEQIDAVAERARAIGVRAAGSWRELTDSARLKAVSGAGLSGKRMVVELLALHERMIVRLREDVELCANEYGDAGTADFLTGLMEFHETTAWMLRALSEHHD
jgi:starvation-inducible DNA-binding protein